ncbi:hypothetical protein [Streptomyces sp. NRRL_B-2557]|uniref:hypothetical protein n=1 Tax=Streptomyces sp. NRRL_B-2557 TaxID=3028698 RepID=UPI0029A29960|nr:hypothetical protein [Streptomyces sp. NRRL_B-2557]MDX2748337.1 hypothetical protein [Streptomyces sp. NRRL_B-2557]
MDLYSVMSYLGVPAVVGVSVLRVWLRYRLHRRAVDRAAVRDLPDLFRAFGASTEAAGETAIGRSSGRAPRSGRRQV